MFLRKIRLFILGFSYYIYDLLKFINNSNILYINIDKERLRFSIISNYHIIEKGLTMPNRHLGFGKEALLMLINKCKIFISRYGIDDLQLQHSIRLIKEYKELHENHNFTLDKDLSVVLSDFCKLYKKIEPFHHEKISKEDYFSKTYSPFNVFSASRHSSRYFTGELIDNTKLREAVKLALNAPSACNKQPCRVYYVKNYLLVQKILKLQSGNRGFGHSISSILLLTADIRSYSRFEDRNSAYVDGGILAMNLLYALHFYKIGAIPLLYISSRKRNCELQSYVKLSDAEIPILIIGVGNLPDEVLLAESPRDTIDYVYKEIE